MATNPLDPNTQANPLLQMWADMFLADGVIEPEEMAMLEPLIVADDGGISPDELVLLDRLEAAGANVTALKNSAAVPANALKSFTQAQAELTSGPSPNLKLAALLGSPADRLGYFITTTPDVMTVTVGAVANSTISAQVLTQRSAVIPLPVTGGAHVKVVDTDGKTLAEGDVVRLVT